MISSWWFFIIIIHKRDSFFIQIFHLDKIALKWFSKRHLCADWGSKSDLKCNVFDTTNKTKVDNKLNLRDWDLEKSILRWKLTILLWPSLTLICDFYSMWLLRLKILSLHIWRLFWWSISVIWVNRVLVPDKPIKRHASKSRLTGLVHILVIPILLLFSDSFGILSNRKVDHSSVKMSSSSMRKNSKFGVLQA